MVIPSFLREARSGLYFSELQEAQTPAQVQALHLLDSIRESLPKYAFSIFGYFYDPFLDYTSDELISIGFELLFDGATFTSGYTLLTIANRIADAFPGTVVFLQYEVDSMSKYLNRKNISVLFPLRNVNEIPAVAKAAIEIVLGLIPDWDGGEEGAERRK